MNEDRDLSSDSAARQDLWLERRSFMKGIAWMTGGSLASAVSSRTAHAQTADGEKPSHAISTLSIQARDDDAVVATSAGKVAGYIRKGIFTFKGIPYGDTTEGANRFLPPVKAKP